MRVLLRKKGGQEIPVANPVSETISYQTHYAFERRVDGVGESGPG